MSCEAPEVLLLLKADGTASQVLFLPEVDGAASHAMLKPEADETASQDLLTPATDEMASHATLQFEAKDETSQAMMCLPASQIKLLLRLDLSAFPLRDNPPYILSRPPLTRYYLGGSFSAVTLFLVPLE